MKKQSPACRDILSILLASRTNRPLHHPLEGLEAPPRNEMIYLSLLKIFEKPIVPIVEYITPNQYRNYCEKRIEAFCKQKQEKTQSSIYQNIIYDPEPRDEAGIMVIRVGTRRWERVQAYYVKRAGLPNLLGVTA